MDTRATSENAPLRAFHNGYEVVAAHSAEEAKAILRRSFARYDEDDLDGDGWTVLPPEKDVRDEDGGPTTTVGAILAESPEPRHLWSCDV